MSETLGTRNIYVFVIMPSDIDIILSHFYQYNMVFGLSLSLDHVVKLSYRNSLTTFSISFHYSMSLEYHRLQSDNDDGGRLVETSNNSTQFSSSQNLITHHIPLDGQIFLHQSTNHINSRTNQFSIYNNNMTAFTSTTSPTPVRSSKLLVLQQSPHANGLHNHQHETFIAGN